jgi:hypothetical protein
MSSTDNDTPAVARIYSKIWLCAAALVPSHHHSGCFVLEWDVPTSERKPEYEESQKG